MRGASCAEIGTGFSSRRLRLAFFLPRMWLVIARRPRTLPLAVSLKRFLAPEWVFIFGIVGQASKAKARGFADDALAGVRRRRLRRRRRVAARTAPRARARADRPARARADRS